MGFATSALLAGCLPAGDVDPAYGGGGSAAAPCPVVDDDVPWASASGRFGGSIVVACPDEGDDYLLAAFDPAGQVDQARPTEPPDRSVATIVRVGN